MLIVQKHGHTNTASAHAALLSDLSHADTSPLAALDVPTLEECTDVYDDIGASLSFNSFAFISSLTPGRDLSNIWEVDSACLINLTACRGDLITVEPPSGSTRIGNAGLNVLGTGIIRFAVPLVYGHIIHRTIHALFTPDFSSRSAQRIGHLLNVCWLQSHCGCEFLFPLDFDIGLLVVPRGIGVLKPSENGLYMMSH
jgi:hypothetical protein